MCENSLVKTQVFFLSRHSTYIDSVSVNEGLKKRLSVDKIFVMKICLFVAGMTVREESGRQVSGSERHVASEAGGRAAAPAPRAMERTDKYFDYDRL